VFDGRTRTGKRTGLLTRLHELLTLPASDLRPSRNAFLEIAEGMKSKRPEQGGRYHPRRWRQSLVNGRLRFFVRTA
jgi:hypothetical protein